ncbi:MAG: asparagine synthase (glutamine-hydrolyzing) [Bacteroidia bacterium]|nr:asparagine synthase (glutamine-hydrolyzing) [Bacteroidia bacterium]
MCGIAGFIDNSLTTDESASLIERMLQSIAHRGPDNRSVWKEMPVVLGHNRLTIIDLSDTANQPMEYKDAVITYNGEIYNYIEIKKELEVKGYTFKTNSDTEVILASYREWGTDCVKKFVGMWAFALWDKRNKTLFCSRDRFGIKPFYYIHTGDKFYFGSEYKPLKIVPVFHSRINLNQVSRGLQLGWCTYHDETYYEIITQLPEASNLIFKDGKVTIEKYWDLDLSKKFSGSFEKIKQKFFELFTDSIRLHMRSDVEVGACLSGGLDSSSIASSVSTTFPGTKFQTFTIFYSARNEVDERPWVNEVIGKYPSLIPHYFSPTDDDISQHFANANYHADVPLSASSHFSQYFVMQLAAKNKIKVLLDGQGSDEMLAGYMHSFYRLFGGYFASLKIGKYATQILSLAIHQKYSPFKIVDVKLKSVLSAFFSEQKLYELEYKNYLPFLSNDEAINFSLDKNDGTRLNNFLYHLMFTTSLPTLLQYEDRNSMAFSIESRVPFLDHRLVEFIFSLSDENKIKNGMTKYVLRNSLKNILPEKIRERKDKKGFVTPGEVRWLRGPLRNLLESDFSKLDFINQKKAKEVIRQFKEGNNKNANLVWRLATLNDWLKHT